MSDCQVCLSRYVIVPQHLTTRTCLIWTHTPVRATPGDCLGWGAAGVDIKSVGRRSPPTTPAGLHRGRVGRPLPHAYQQAA
eukprot:364631-Chlamydomonas_euryale.AAC.3